jgi:ferric-dicitrate binding protein FerR (iron transport regulator)
MYFENEWKFIVNELIGESTIEEKKKFNNWINSNIKNESFYNQLKTYWQMSEEKEEPSELVLERLRSKYLSNDVVKLDFGNPKRNFYLNILKYASILLLLIITSIYVSIEEDEVNYFTLNVPNGQRSNMVLPDGSEVFLNSGTTLKYAQNFNDKNRAVIVDGEAYFHVKHINNNKFIVKSPRMSIEVLGTKFNVNDYSTDKLASVYLEDGKIRAFDIKNVNKQFIMKPKNKLVVNNIGNYKFDSDFSDEQTVWRNNSIVFNKTPFNEVCKRLERWFDIKIKYDTSVVENIKYSGSLNKLTISDALEFIKLTSPIEYKIIEREVYIEQRK